MPGFRDAEPGAEGGAELINASASRAPALPAGEELLDADLYAVTRLIAGRAPRASSARQYPAIYTRFAALSNRSVGQAQASA
jgi:hypothetical protein